MEDNWHHESSSLVETEPDGEENRKMRLAVRVWEENKRLWKIAFPSMLARLTSFGVLVVTQSFIGHINQVDLAGYALVITFTLRFAKGILLGMSSATETLCGQAFGAKQYHMMGIYLQRSWIIQTVLTTLLLPLFIFAAPMFELLGENDSIAEASETISLWFIPILYNFPFFMTVQMYLQAQLKNKIVGYLSAISFISHLILSWVFVYEFNWGVPGAMGSLIISQWGVVFGQLVYVFGGWCPETWNGFSIQAFKDLLTITKLSLSSGFMLCLEIWYASVLVLLAGYSSNAVVDISAFSICLSLNTGVFMIFNGFLGAACVRVANELGKGDAKAAKFSMKVNLLVSSTVGVLFWLTVIVFGHEIPYLFTDNDEVADAAANLSVLLAFMILLNSLQATFSGVAVGTGSQAKVAIINLCSYYIVGIPIGALLAYVADFGIKGIWVGMLCGQGLQVLALVIMTRRIDWNEEVNKTSRHLNRFLLDSSEESNDNTYQS